MGNTPDARVAHTIAAMEQRLALPWRVRELAALVHLSPSRFAHVFRATTGLSPLRYLHELRMERARMLLERTSMPVREVMLLVGRPDPSHFARDFRRRFGVSPRGYRREHATAAHAISGRGCEV